MGKEYRGLTLHPLVIGLIQSMPPPGSIWPKEKRALWIALAANCLDLLYNEPASSDRGKEGEG